MRVIALDPARPDAAPIAEAAAALRQGALVAFPTETVYGLGANALDTDAVRAIFAAKGRPSFNPLIVHVQDAAAARQCAAVWPVAAEQLAAAFWPGPLTLVLPKRAHIPDVVSAGLPTVAVRVPAHGVAQALLRAARVPLAAPSANRSTEVSPTTAAHVAKGLGDRVALILDAGPTDVGIESTVVDLTGGSPALLRPGSISTDHLAAVLGTGIVSPISTAAEEAPRPAPGMLDRHYAPRARVHLFDPADREQAARAVRHAARRAAAVVMHPLNAPLENQVLMPGEPAEYARRLYSTLHEMDAAGWEALWIERVPNGSGWDAVRDRLRRAATP